MIWFHFDAETVSLFARELNNITITNVTRVQGKLDCDEVRINLEEQLSHG